MKKKDGPNATEMRSQLMHMMQNSLESPEVCFVRNLPAALPDEAAIMAIHGTELLLWTRPDRSEAPILLKFRTQRATWDFAAKVLDLAALCERMLQCEFKRCDEPRARAA